MIKMGECELCNKYRDLASVQDHNICEQCYHAVVEILLSLLKDPDTWGQMCEIIRSGYTEPELPAEPELATFRRRSHENLRKG